MKEAKARPGVSVVNLDEVMEYATDCETQTRIAHNEEHSQRVKE